MEWIENRKILIVGLGLMGGSYARALKRLGFTVTAIDRNPEAIEYALKERIIKEGSSGDGDEKLIREADSIVS